MPTWAATATFLRLPVSGCDDASFASQQPPQSDERRIAQQVRAVVGARFASHAMTSSATDNNPAMAAMAIEESRR